MTDLIAARLTMSISLGFHIVLAVVGMVMPFLMVAAHRKWLQTGDNHYYHLTRMWARGTAIFFAVGAVSGTALSFELGLLWPQFMGHAGPIFGMPFSLEGAAFFIEAIALGVYLYGWTKVHPRLHWWTGVVVGIAGVSSGALVVAANGWMNAPSGFTWDGVAAHDVDPIAAMLNDAWPTMATHMVLAAFQSVGFAVAGVHAFALLKSPQSRTHHAALRIALVFGAVAALIQPISGHISGQRIATRQPAKLAAAEALFRTQPRAPLLIGGIPDEATQTVSMGIEIPGALSFIAHNDVNAVVTGLDQIPRDEWPPVAPVHFAFQTMIAIGTWLALLGLMALYAIVFRRDWLTRTWMLRLIGFSAPLGFIAVEAGWIVTEVGRQPWIIYGIMRTRDAVTPVPGQVMHLAVFTALYACLALSSIWMWRQQVMIPTAHATVPPAYAKWRLTSASNTPTQEDLP